MSETDNTGPDYQGLDELVTKRAGRRHPDDLSRKPVSLHVEHSVFEHHH